MGLCSFPESTVAGNSGEGESAWARSVMAPTGLVGDVCSKRCKRGSAAGRRFYYDCARSPSHKKRVARTHSQARAAPGTKLACSSRLHLVARACAHKALERSFCILSHARAPARDEHERSWLRQIVVVETARQRRCGSLGASQQARCFDLLAAATARPLALKSEPKCARAPRPGRLNESTGWRPGRIACGAKKQAAG